MTEELYHHGVKGMKWGVRNEKKSKQSSAPRTEWGKNRAYAKEQDAANKQRWKATKADVKAGKLSKKSSKYKYERNRYRLYNNMKYSYSNDFAMTKAARGKQMQKLKISANQPVSSLKTSTVIKEDAKAYIKQTAKYTAIGLASSAAVYAGRNYIAKQLNFAAADRLNKTPRLTSGDMINLKSRQYKVKTIR